MPKGKRIRDHAAIYARRKARAQARGYTGYYQRRKVSEYNQEWIDRMFERMDTEGYDWADLDQDDPTYWIWFRVNYGKGTAA